MRRTTKCQRSRCVYNAVSPIPSRDGAAPLCLSCSLSALDWRSGDEQSQNSSQDLETGKGRWRGRLAAARSHRGGQERPATEQPSRTSPWRHSEVAACRLSGFRTQNTTRGFFLIASHDCWPLTVHTSRPKPAWYLAEYCTRLKKKCLDFPLILIRETKYPN